MATRHFTQLTDLTPGEVRHVLDVSHRLKAELIQGTRRPFFAGRVLGLLFEKPSLRTRVSFEALIGQHGGQALYLGQDVGWGKREPIEDFVPVLTSYLDGLVIRANAQTLVDQAAKLSRCTVINGLTEKAHPCQALADLMTVEELCGGLERARIAYIGDANNVAHCLATICAMLQVPIQIASPYGYQFTREFADSLNQIAGREIVLLTDDPVRAVSACNIIYTDVWTSMGQEAERHQRLEAFANFQVSERLWRHAAPDARFLHCLPARRGEEVAAEIIDGPASAVVEQAANRLHAQKGLLAWLWGVV